MADSFLGKLRGRRPEANSALAEARSALERLIAERPALRGPALWLNDMLCELAAPCEKSGALVSSEAAQAKLAAGIPLLRDVPISWDVKAFRNRWRNACKTLRHRQEDESATRLASAFQKGKADPQEWIAFVLSGRREWLNEQAIRLEADPARIASLVRLTLFPTLVALQTSSRQHLQSSSWERGECPACGSGPLLAEFRGLDQLRYLRCGLCAAAWKAPRLFCPWCGNRNHEQLGFFHREGEESRLRAATCLACRGYVKTFSTLGELPPLQLWVADLSALHLDLALVERGFTSAIQ